MPDISVRAEFRGHPSVEEIRGLVGLPRPVGLRALIPAYDQPMTFEEDLVTDDGTPLGGHHKVTINKNGDWAYEGWFRATGWPTYDVSLAGRLVGTDGTTVIFTAHGTVYGTNESGDRQYNFSTSGNNPGIANHWGALRRSTLNHDLKYDGDWFGTAGDVLVFLGKVAAGAALGGVGGALIFAAAEAIDGLSLPELSLPGTVGVIVTGGIMLVGSPVCLIPAIVAGATAATVTAELVNQRPMSEEEKAFADQVFKGTVPWDRVVLTNISGAANRAFTIPGPGNAILVNLGEGYDAPLTYTGFGGPATGPKGPFKQPGENLIHELTHAWQIARRTFIVGYVCDGIDVQVGTLGGNMSVYNYSSDTQDWHSDLNIEQQANIVGQWFGGDGLQAPYGPMRDDNEGPGRPNPYFHYIRDHIRAGID